MPHPLTRNQQLENRAFLEALRRTGNARAAAQELGVHRVTFTKRRAKHPDFAAAWDQALLLADAALAERAGAGRKAPARASARAAARTPDAAPDAGAPPHIVRVGGRLQLRRKPAGRLTREAEQAFLAALSATANIRLSAAATGFSHSAFYALRLRDPGFAREMRLALERGYERLEAELMSGFEPFAFVHDGWRHNDPPPIPPMNVDQAITLLQIHHKTVRLWADRPDHKRKRGENSVLYNARLVAKWQAERAREMEDAAIAGAARYESAVRSRFEPAPPVLPALDQVRYHKDRRGGG